MNCSANKPPSKYSMMKDPNFMMTGCSCMSQRNLLHTTSTGSICGTWDSPL